AEIPLRTADEMTSDLVPVDNPPPGTERMQHQTQMVRVLFQERWIHQSRHHARGCQVSHQTVRVTIEHDGGIRLVALDQELQDSAQVRHLVCRQRRAAVHVRVTAASSRRLRSRKGTSSASASIRTAWRLACVRPVSTKLTCRVRHPARQARSEWVTPRGPLPSRSNMTQLD